MFVIIKNGGKQYKVQSGDIVKLDSLGQEKGKKVMVKVIDNFLSKEVFEPIQGFFINKNCPWYLIDNITNDIQDEKYY